MTWLEKIKTKIGNKNKELQDNDDLLEDLIEDAFYEIMEHSNANSYNLAWDRVLVQAVLEKYNTIGIEGSISRNSGGVVDTFASTNVSSPTISRNITPFIRPSGYAYSNTRFNYPE